MKFIDKIDEMIENNKKEYKRLRELKENKDYYITSLVENINSEISDKASNSDENIASSLAAVIDAVPSMLSQSFDKINGRIRDISIVVQVIELVKSEYVMFQNEEMQRESKYNKANKEITNKKKKEPMRKTGERPKKLRDIRNNRKKIDEDTEKEKKKTIEKKSSKKDKKEIICIAARRLFHIYY